MPNTLVIANRELKSFFTTWIGYIVIFAALLIDGLLFNAFAIGKESRLSADVLYQFFYFSSGLGMVAGVFLAIRLIAEERSSGTIVLFLTSPVSERQFIYGKYLSAMVVFLILQVFSLYLPLLVLLTGKISFGHLLAGYLGTTLLGLSVLAISLFASTMTASQLVAGVVAASMTVILLVLWLLAGVVDEPFRGIFSYLAIHNQHFRQFGLGIVQTKHLIYYLSVIIFFLECSVKSMESRRLEG
tara:strand:- start:950 stop:1678 length:729 start_codon:yes stop_codon:yes gene_type:complete